VKRQVSAAGFGKAIITATARRLQRVVDGLQWEPARSTWSDYATDHSYDEEALRTKELFVERAVQQHRGLVWDLGCNTGRFSLIASRYADYVVSVDSDAGSIERLYRRLSSEQHRKILPLTLDVTDLSPSLGWYGQERRAFVDRGQPDLVLCLALVHHLVITANIPVVDLVRWFHSLSAALVVEFPLPTDPMVKRLMATRDQCYDDYSVACFESALESHFAVRDRVVLHHGSRVLYYAVPKMDVARPDRAGDRAKDA
jgi:SAM-dependent methyltransferase